MPKKNIFVAVCAVICLVILGLIAYFPKGEEVKRTFVGKRFVPVNRVEAVSVNNGVWFTPSEFAGVKVNFGSNSFVSGRSYKLAGIGVDEYVDPVNYVNGDWFSWQSADGMNYSVRMKDGEVNAYKANNSFKPVSLLYDTTYGFVRMLELLVFDGVMNTEIMPFIDSQKKEVLYFDKETLSIDDVLKSRPVSITPRGNDDFKMFAKVVDTPTKISNKVMPTKVEYGLNIGQTAQVFSMNTLDGQKIKLSDFYGRKTVINIWATWCGVCITEFPIINELYEKEKGVNVVAVCADGNNKQIQRIKDKYSTKYPCNFQMVSCDTIERNYNLKGFPTTYFLDEYGVIRYIKIGAFNNVVEAQNILESY
jgi:thiol-disulfide isomerase/thioredoxin